VIVPIGEWTLRVACEAATRWPASIRISVNLSPIQVRDEGFIGMIDDVLSTTGLAANRLELELTETSFLEANRTTLACLTELRDRGIRIALDDFGTGYSSLQYLAEFPFDTIKIDRGFVNKLGRDKSALAILEAITTMAKNLGMVTVAEGLETEEQLRLLEGVGCTLGQGFLFGRPRSAQDFERPARSPNVSRREALVSPMA
jgi:EAL domain-containing protein (putative c-di-GMP-specific phosphodiesterase class I)